MDRPDLAALATLVHAKRKLRVVSTQIDKATRAIAQATEHVEQYGAHCCTEPADADRVRDLVSLALAEHQEVDVVLLVPSPTARARRGRRR